MVSGVKALAKVGGGSTVRSAVAGSATGRPAWKRLLVVLGKVPTVAVPGTSRSTSIEHMPPSGGSSPPLRVRSELDVLVSEDPRPQMSKSGRLVSIRPVITSSSSSVKLMPTAVSGPGLVMVKVSFGVPVAVVAPSKDLLNSRSWMTSRSSLAASPEAAEPPIMPVTALVVLV